MILPKQKHEIGYNYKKRAAANKYNRLAAVSHDSKRAKYSRQEHNIASLVHKQSSKRKKEVIFFSIMIICLMVTGIAFISQYGLVLSKNYQIHQASQEIEQLEKEIDELRLQVRQYSSLERIETIAINELGMQYPEDKQWLLISTSEN